MRLSPTLTWYFGKHVLFSILAVLALLIGLILIGDTIELLRRAGGKPDATVGIVVQMATSRIPFMTEKVLPFAVLFGSMFSFWKLTGNQELVVTRAAGVSAWQFLLPPILCALILGSIQVAALNPLSSILLQRYEMLEARYLQNNISVMNLSSSGLWLRQGTQDGQAVIYARAVRSQQDDQIDLRNVTIFRFQNSDDFTTRIDAARAVLEPGTWHFYDAWTFTPGQASQFTESMKLPTNLTARKIQDSFASPETMSFWDLKPFINLLERAGFNATRHRIHFHSLLSRPLLLCAMVLIAAAFCLKFSRRRRASLVIGGGVTTGFILYFCTDVISALGVSGGIPPILSAWAPAGISLLLGVSTLLHLEDG
ncbi:LPS export ABC transporter permease LptG [Thalassospira povalilytica]|uniref:LPS export ABC transporter permease LptG n=1 Tax=Thalassospira povalilytica TaxID=732237 RepID=UPI003AA83A16